MILRFCIVCSLLQPDLTVLSMLEYVDGNITIILWPPVTLLWHSTRGQGHATVALHPGSRSRYCGSPPGVKVTLLWHSTRGQGHANGCPLINETDFELVYLPYIFRDLHQIFNTDTLGL